MYILYKQFILFMCKLNRLIIYLLLLLGLAMKTKIKQTAKTSPKDKNITTQQSEGVEKKSTSPVSAKKSASKKIETASRAGQAKAEKQPKKDKPKKIKMVRDSFTMPESDYAKLDELKKKCLEAGVHVKKSELLRAGLICLSKLNNGSLIKEVEQVEIIKTGRPANV